MQLGRVFISSVFGGMLDLREVAAQAARLIGLEPVLTEHHVAQAGAVRDALARETAACDTYVGLFDRRRGTVPPGDPDPAPSQKRNSVSPASLDCAGSRSSPPSPRRSAIRG